MAGDADGCVELSVLHHQLGRDPCREADVELGAAQDGTQLIRQREGQLVAHADIQILDPAAEIQQEGPLCGPALVVGGYNADLSCEVQHGAQVQLVEAVHQGDGSAVLDQLDGDHLIGSPADLGGDLIDVFSHRQHGDHLVRYL